MKILGWIAFLVLIALGLIIYNVKYLPLHEEHTRMSNENKMWQAQVKELQNRINRTDSSQAPLYSQSFLWEDLFGDGLSFNLTEPAQVMLKEIVPKLQETTGEVIIAGHCDKQALVPELKSGYATERELSYAKAMAVLNFLKSWGISDERLVCVGYGSTRPLSGISTHEQAIKNRRVEIYIKP
ncbi:MAG: OmpA family protein [Candidatus Latescibacteria bacterium]|nr:OmpA family protein [Candidatus Latescibacterota bacterium]